MSTIGNINTDDPTGEITDAFADVDYVFEGFGVTHRGEPIAKAYKQIGDQRFEACAVGVSKRDAARSLYKNITR